MTAKGRINASQLTEGTRIIVKIERNDAGLMTGWDISRTKTGEDVVVARVTCKDKASDRRGYYLTVSISDSQIYAEPIQTMWLAPEDPAGVKRAHVEALAEDAAYDNNHADAILAHDEDAWAAKRETAQPEGLVDATAVVTITPTVQVPGILGLRVEARPHPVLDSSPLTDATYRIMFDRIGRHHDPLPLETVVKAEDASRVQHVLAEECWMHARQYMISRDFEVSVDMDELSVSIGWGRFGKGRVTRVTQ